MKFSSISKLIHVNQANHIDICEIEPLLERWGKSYGMDLNPDFQRGHVWNRQTKIKFIEFILRGGVVAPLRFNSPVFGGHPHSKDSDLSEDIVLVDGKQRLTAIQDFLSNSIPVFGNNYLSNFEDRERLVRSVSITYQVNRLQTRKELLTWYLEMNEGQIAHAPEEIERVRNLMDNI